MFEGLFQPSHLLLILLIALVVFGPGKLPEIGRGLGQAVRDFRRTLTEPWETPAPEKGDRQPTTSPQSSEERERATAPDEHQITVHLSRNSSAS